MTEGFVFSMEYYINLHSIGSYWNSRNFRRLIVPIKKEPSLRDNLNLLIISTFFKLLQLHYFRGHLPSLPRQKLSFRKVLCDCFSRIAVTQETKRINCAYKVSQSGLQHNIKLGWLAWVVIFCLDRIPSCEVGGNHFHNAFSSHTTFSASGFI